MTANSKFQNYMSPSDSEMKLPGMEKPKEPVMVELDRNDIETKAKIIVAHDFNTTFFPNTEPKATHKDFYVVWKVKALQNWKVLVSTDIISGQYWELTFDGNQQQTYMDHYVKRSNQCVTDAAYAAMS
jgi:Family of unknown function (DUF6275)